MVWKFRLSLHRCIRVVLRTATFALLSSGLSAQADTRLRTTSYAYDTSGLLIGEVREPDVPNDCLQTAHEYDARGNRTKSTTTTCLNASGPALLSAVAARMNTTGFDAEGRFATSSANALGHSESKAYDTRFGGVTSLTGPNGLVTQWSYDTLGRKTLESRADGTSTAWTYKLCTESGAGCPGPIGGAASVWVSIEQSYSAAPVAANAPDRRLYYDQLERVVRMQTQGFDLTAGSAPELVQDTTYNQLGQVAAKSDVYLKSAPGTAVWTSYTYDVLGRVTQESRPDAAAVATGGAAKTLTVYNGASVTVTNAKNQSKTTLKNALEQVVRVTDALGGTITYAYDALGNLLATKAAGDPLVSTLSSTTSMKYDVRGNKLFMLDPAMGDWEYRYNAYGELVYQRDSLNQASTMVYDVLGRMTRRSELDLVSEWSYDKYFDLSACAKGIGKLCEAKADNTYNRKLSYDQFGRLDSTATMLDALRTVRQTYDASGRPLTKTWPDLQGSANTGYQVTNSYSPLGFLKTVTGGGTNGFAQTVTYNVRAMSPDGQVTEYRYGNPGNEVTTLKTLDPLTDRMLGQSVTRAGQSTGNILKHSHAYDALGNLVSRNDDTVGVLTAENFSYDSLNRLTTATLVGGSGLGNAVTEVMYDALGNITYKSDVGRFWYDAARPNRMTNVTLQTAPGASQGLSATRQLSFAFDDYKVGARVVNSVTVGNGNLMYTVAYDPGNSRHHVRWESYTSFNMPDEFRFGNFSTSATCLAAYVLHNGLCYPATAATEPNTCPASYTLSGGNCVRAGSAAIALSASYTCPFGGSVVGSACANLAVTGLAPGGSNVSDRTLKFVYGPEHQRVRQTITLTGNGTSSYFAGTVWYLNGEDSLGMSYEKEVRANGTTEHKHYIGAQGVVFAVFTSRAGNLNGLPASSTSYLHHDHLGSVAAISDEAGVRVEQLAFDPWGKRRYIMTNPGAPDDADAIVGIKTDRGYTMHEHLDEMALVHMNGRIYDPRIARFLSADPIIQAPYNLKAYNRYSYVWNNPLRLWDPTGYFWVHAAGAFALGFTVDLAIQAYEGKKFADLAKFDSLRDASIAGSAAVTTGALGGRLAVSAMRAEMKVVEAVTQTALVGGSTNALATITVETLHGKPPTVKDTALSFVAGTAGAYGGAKLANSGTRIAEKAREAGGVMAHIGTETLTPFSGGGKAVVGSSVGLEVGKVASDVGSVVGKEIADRELEAFDF
jgi:RHS repeat-associated protein